MVESGGHEELMGIEGGTYRTLVGLQTLPGMEDSSREDNGGEMYPLLPHHSHAHHNHTGHSGHDEHSFHDEIPTIEISKSEDSKVKFAKPHQSRLWQLSRPEWKWVGTALCTAVVNGCTFPLYSLLLSSIVSVLLNVDSDYVREQVNFWCLMFLALAGVVFIAIFTQLYAFTGTFQSLSLGFLGREGGEG